MKRNIAAAVAALILVAGLGAVLGADRFSSYQPGLNSPAENGFAITPSDTDLTYTTRGLYVGTGGDVVCTLKGGQELTFANVPDGVILPLRIVNIDSTGTTATGLIGLY